MALKFQKLEEDYLSLLTEFNTLKCKLECKTDSLLILSHELEQCRSERDQYKLMADQLRERYSALKRRVEGWGPSLLGVYDVDGLKCEREKSLVQLLCELKDKNKALKYEAENLKLRLEDAQGDIKILREEIAKQNSGSNENVSLNYVPFCEKEALVKQLETLNMKCKQLTQDLQAVLDEKEELVTARDQYRHKFERLNKQMNYILRGNQPTLVDIDGIIMQNKYLQERVKQAEEEKAVTASALAKCKAQYYAERFPPWGFLTNLTMPSEKDLCYIYDFLAVLEKKRTKGGMRSSIASGLAVSAKQVEQLLQSNPFLDHSSKSSNVVEFRNLVMTLLEALSDKSIALSHQKKANKILGNRVSELEEKIKSMEVSTLWRIPDPSQFSFFLRGCGAEELNVPEKTSPQHSLISSVDNNEQKDESSENILDDQSIKSDDQCSASELSADVQTNSGFSDLDIVPTKDYPVKGVIFDRRESMSSCSHYSDSKISSESPSPIHTHRTLHSDSEITPKKSVNVERIFKSSANKDRHEFSSLDVEDLPPKLQKLVAAAFAEIENETCEEETVVRSPARKQKSPICANARNDPNC